MVYSFELIKHANVHYREAVSVLSRCELLSMLHTLSVDCDVSVEMLGGGTFLTFECRELAPHEIIYLSGHSSVSFMAEKRPGPVLRPLSARPVSYLPEDLPEVLKYKGKTAVPFTRMMINTAVSLTPFAVSPEPLTFFDPLCGKATGCFCALTMGMNAVGIDLDSKDLKEAASYFTRYLKLHKLKHEVCTCSETAGKTSLPVTRFSFADTRKHYLSGNRRHLSLICADTGLSPYLFRHGCAHVVAADLPYGVQHAPKSGAKPEMISSFLKRVLPAWKSSLHPKGAVAVSFNSLTLPSRTVRTALIEAGLRPVEDDLYTNLKHNVEQAVDRDVVFALNSKEE